MTAEQSSSFWKEAKTNLREAANLRNLAFYGTAIIAFVALSILLPYQTQVYLSIAAGITVALLPNQVRLGFVIMMTTLVYQIRLTYDSHKSRKPRATHNTNGSKQI